MTAKRVGVEGLWDVALDCLPYRVFHFGVERAHDGGDLHLVVGLVLQPRVSRGHTNDRWMVTILRALCYKSPGHRLATYPRGVLACI